MTSKPVLYGYDASTYTRIARLMLVEKGVDHDYVRVADWSGYEKRPGFEDLHPFAKVPVFEHGGFRLYETGAILRYVDEAFQGPALQPASPHARARMQQIISVYDSYAFPIWVKVLVTQRLFQPLADIPPDETAITAALPQAYLVAKVLDGLLADRVGSGFDLADIYLVPAVRYLEETPEGAEILDGCAHLAGWWQARRDCPSVVQIAPQTAACAVGRRLPSSQPGSHIARE